LNNFDDVWPHRLFECEGLKMNDRKRAVLAHYAVMTHGPHAKGYLRSQNVKPNALLALRQKALSEVAAASASMPTPADLTARYRASFITQMFGSGGTFPHWLKVRST
jgi:hypothetical protein